jgi:hypothetical protein
VANVDTVRYNDFCLGYPKDNQRHIQRRRLWEGDGGCYVDKNWYRDGVVRIVTTLRAGKSSVRIPVPERGISLLKKVLTCTKAHAI